jgi:hypothetical protein
MIRPSASEEEKIIYKQADVKINFNFGNLKDVPFDEEPWFITDQNISNI